MAKQKQPQKKNKVSFVNRISVRLIFITFLVFALGLTLCTYFATSFATNRLTESAESNLLASAKEKGTSIERYVADQKAIAQLVQNNSTVIEQGAIFAATGQIDPQVQVAVSKSLESLYVNTGQIYENLFVTFGSTGYADCLGNKTLHDVAEEHFYQECVQNGYYFGNNVSPVTGLPVYVIAYAIYNPYTNEFLGTVNMSIAMAGLGNDIVSDEQNDVTVLDKEGLVIATGGPHSKEEDLLTSIAEVDPEGFNGMLATGSGNIIVDLSAWGGGTTSLAYYVTDNFILEVSRDEADITAGSAELTRNLIIISVMVCIIGLAIIFVLVSVIISSMNKATKDIQVVIDDMNNGRGDLTKTLKTKRKDEISVLIRGINTLMDTMGGIIANVQQTTGLVNVSSADISAQIEKAEVDLTSVSATMEEMSASSEETSASLSQVMVQVDDVAALVSSVNEQSAEQARYANEVVQKVRMIQEDEQEQKRIANERLQEVTESLQDKIAKAKKVQEISNLTDEILNITSQTNLLSLNASIEAARAGEAGKGFAVVADEIRQLADSSKEAANRIQEVTMNVIQSVEELADEAQGVTEFMIENNEKSLADTERLTESYSSDILKLAESMTEFEKSSDDIQNSMTDIRSEIEAVNVAAEETAKGITNVAEATVSLSTELQMVVGKTNDNVTETNSLTNEVNKFKVE